MVNSDMCVLLFLERRSVSVRDVAKAFKANIKGSVSMMFVNDEKLSFTFGPDDGAEINFGKMKVVDVYEERYLVAHSLFDGMSYTMCHFNLLQHSK